MPHNHPPTCITPLTRGDPPATLQVLGSEGVTGVVKHDCRIDRG